MLAEYPGGLRRGWGPHPAELVYSGAMPRDEASIAAPSTAPAPPTETPALTLGRALSASRANDFMQCPLLYRYRVVEHLPEPPSAAAVKGTLVHAVLEDLFARPAEQRTADTARGMLRPRWERLRAESDTAAELFGSDRAAELEPWLSEAEALLDTYFEVEDPARLEPAARELYVETSLPGGLTVRGYIDRVDVNDVGDVRVVDYKTGRCPKPQYEGKALFQMRFYALLLWHTRGVLPRLLQLIYLKDGRLLRFAPTQDDVTATERKVEALWAAIEQAADTGDWRPRTSPLCGWCSFRSLCPAWGGTPTPVPRVVVGPASSRRPR